MEKVIQVNVCLLVGLTIFLSQPLLAGNDVQFLAKAQWGDGLLFDRLSEIIVDGQVAISFIDEDSNSQTIECFVIPPAFSKFEIAKFQLKIDRETMRVIKLSADNSARNNNPLLWEYQVVFTAEEMHDIEQNIPSLTNSELEEY